MSVSHILQPHHSSASAPSRYFMRPYHERNARIPNTVRCLSPRIVNSFLLLESYGGLGGEARKFIKVLAQIASTHDTFPNFRDYAYRSLSICLVDGNSFVLNNGALLARESEGALRRDHRRLASFLRPSFRLVQAAPSPLASSDI
jgi:hypothetical protein